MTRVIRIPFAENGDREEIPVTQQASGDVSYAQGYTLNYELDPNTDPSAKRVERTKMNQLMNDITTAVRDIQSHGVTEWITTAENGGAAFSYTLGSVVLYNGVLYQSLVNNNTQLPTVTANWAPITNLNTTPGRLLNVQRFVLSGTYTPTPGTKKALIRAVGGGGGGGGCPATSSTQQSTAGGGQSGAYAEIILDGPFQPSYNITVGTGGVAGTKAPTSGGGGGSTLIPGVLTVPGGAGGYAGAAVAPTISVGGVSNGTAFPTVITGTNRVLMPAAGGQPALILGSSTNQAKGGTGGSSPLGIGGQGGLGGAPGLAGLGFGAGGGGCSQLAGNAGDVGGAGSTGYLEIWEFA